MRDDDGALVVLMQQNDPAGLSGLYDRHAGRVLGLARRIVGNGGDAEDIVQEVFLQAWNQRNRYVESRGGVLPWLLMMTRSRAIDRTRATRTRLEQPFTRRAEIASSTTPSTDDALMNRWAAAAVASLPPGQRLAVELAYIGGYTHSEIATLLKQPLGTVKTRIRSAMLKLRNSGSGLDPLRSSRETPFTVPLSQIVTDSVRARPLDALDGLRVLVVDDDPDTLEMVALVLEFAGASVMRGGSALEALNRMTTAWPDVLLADLTMPGEDGFDLVRKARALENEDRRLRAGAFTAKTADRDRHAALTAGYDIYLTKPIMPDAMVRAVKSLAHSRPCERSPRSV